jgi:CubicO group peptidase (beta-lactamase class C family)
VEQPAIPFFERELSAEQAAERAGITVGHLLAMRSGLASTSGRNYGAWVTSSDWVRHAVARPVEFAPGEAMIYSTGSTHLLSAILTRATGESTHAYARSRLAEPLGIQLPSWPRGPEGVYFGGNDMLVSPRALLRFGEMYRGGGALDGRQIVPESWVRASWDTRDRTDGGRRAPNRHQYGLGWWGRESNGYQVRFAWGYGGQFVFVVPALELTVVFTSDPWSPREGPHNNQLHRMIDELLVPAAMAGAGNGSVAGADLAG